MTRMRATICPTITAGDPDEYRRQMERIAGFASRIHLDLADGKFTPVKLVDIDQLWWPGGMHVDVHLMYKRPFDHADALLELGVQLIIVHAEAEGDFVGFAELAHAAGVKVGVALRQNTKVDVIAPALDIIDHVLVFSGDLGHFGGTANTHLLTKVLHLKQLKPALEIGWDGGVNAKNAAVLAAGGVGVLNVGGYIQHAAYPHAAYETLVHKLLAAPKPRRRQ